MHVTIERKEEVYGLFKKKTRYGVIATIVFSEEEKAIITKAKLTNMYAMDYQIEYMDSGVMVSGAPEFKQLLKAPHERWFHSISEANDWERELRDKQLPLTKAIIDREGETKSAGPSSFEI
jgi:hypothetical protein